MEYFCQRYTHFMSIMLHVAKALYVWFRRRKDNGHLTDLALNWKVARAKKEDCQFSGRTGKHLSLYFMAKKFSMVRFAPQSTHLQYLNLQINSVCAWTKHRRGCHIIT